MSRTISPCAHGQTQHGGTHLVVGAVRKGQCAIQGGGALGVALPRIGIMSEQTAHAARIACAGCIDQRDHERTRFVCAKAASQRAAARGAGRGPISWAISECHPS